MDVIEEIFCHKSKGKQINNQDKDLSSQEYKKAETIGWSKNIQVRRSQI